MLDLSTAQGRRAADRLDSELIGWLTTVSPSGQPQSSPVWFAWTAGGNGSAGEVVIRSRPGAPRMANLASNRWVAFNLNSDASGGDVVTFEGEAHLDGDLSADEAARYRTKYEPEVPGIGMTWDEFVATYAAVVRVRITRLRML
jgi:PPOX class probable F420-dependent enzyme